MIFFRNLFLNMNQLCINTMNGIIVWGKKKMNSYKNYIAKKFHVIQYKKLK